MPCTLGGALCADPANTIDWCRSKGVPVDRWAARAGVYATGPGAAPGRGTVLLRAADLSALDLTADLELVFVGSAAGRTVSLSPITVLSRECVTPGGPDDPDAVFAVDVADRRHLMRMVPFDRAFNVQKANGSGYYTGTLDSGSAWTWQGVVTNLATALGITITLPFTPHGTPENLVYWGHSSALECLCDVLDRLACALTYDPTADEFGAVQLGDLEDTLLDAITDPKVWDGYSASYSRAWRPEKVRVRFPRRPVDSTNWNSPYYTVDVTLAAKAGVEAGTVVQIDDGMSALAATGTPSNSVALALRAQERADHWLLKRDSYERRVLVAWRDFVPEAAGMGGAAVRRVVFDDRYETRTWAEGGWDGLLEAWKPLGGWPVWWPIESGGASGAPNYLAPVRVATTTAGTLSTSFANGQTVDGVTLATGDPILIKNQSTGSENGTYTVNASGAPTRRDTAGAQFYGAIIPVTNGTTNGDSVWLCSNNTVPTVGSTALTFVKIGPLLGSGTDNRLVRWDGTGAIQDSTATLSDAGDLTVPGTSYSNAFITIAGTTTPGFYVRNDGYAEADYFGNSLTWRANSVPAGGSGGESAVYLALHGFGATDADDLAIQATVGGRGGFYLRTVYWLGTTGPKFAVDNASGVRQDGVTGTIAPGAVVTGGIVTGLGSGSYVGTADDNDFTGANTFAAVTINGTLTSTSAATFTPANASTSPATVKAAASQTAYLLPLRDSTNALLGGFDFDGTYRGPADFGEWTSPPPPPPPPPPVSPPPPPPPIPPPP